VARSLVYTDQALEQLAEVLAQWPARALEITQRARRLCLLPYTYGTADGPPGTRRTLVGGGRRNRPHCVIFEVDPDTGRNEDAGLIRILAIYWPGQSRA
jgi:hypothetical protein